MPELYLKSTGKHLGHVSPNDIDFLARHLEEESITDDDYTIDRLTLDYLKTQGISPDLQKILEDALGEANADEVEIRYAAT
jgi:hypothetical protein